MAKVAKSKKTRAISVHSRAARRAASPSAGIDKSLETASGAEDEKLSKKFLSPHGGGISKKKKNKQMTRQQRVRQEKGMERADANMDKLATKITKSHKRGKVVKSRAATWEELNTKTGSGPEKASILALQDDTIDSDDDDEEDEDEETVGKAEALETQPKEITTTTSQGMVTAPDEEVDEVL